MRMTSVVHKPSVRLVSQRVVKRRQKQLQLSEGAAVAADLRRLVLHHVAQVLQLLAARSALLMSAATQTTASVQLTAKTKEVKKQTVSSSNHHHSN